ncbi:YoaK family protein [Rhizobium daejeonense]
MVRPPLSAVLSFNGGYVDTMGFLALTGLFTAHVTGNFVTLGAAIAQGAGGAVAKILALPVFCIVVLVTRLVDLRLEKHGRSALPILLSIKLALFVAAAVLAIRHGPFDQKENLASIVVGMTLVAAMAIQNALHRAHMATQPPTTLMTGTTTQIMLDLADLLTGGHPTDAVAVKSRLLRMGFSVLTFALGCACGALAFMLSPVWCFAVPPVLVIIAMAVHLAAVKPLAT